MIRSFTHKGLARFFKSGISPEMAIRLSIAFDTSAESWLNQQSQYELWHAEQHRKELKVKKLVPPEEAHNQAMHRMSEPPLCSGSANGYGKR